MSMRHRTIVLSCLILGGLALSLAADAGVTGSWSGQLSFVNGKQREVTLTLRVADAKVTGALTGVDGAHDIADGKLDGDTATFSFPSGGSDVPQLDFAVHREGDGLKVKVTGVVKATGQTMAIGEGLLKPAK
jgi:hypothetical protein